MESRRILLLLGQDVEASTSTMKGFSGSGWTWSGADKGFLKGLHDRGGFGASRTETWACLSGD